VTYSAFATNASGAASSFQQLAHRHLDLVSIRINGIPMRRARKPAASSSKNGNKDGDNDDDSGNQNKRVTLCFRGWEGSHLLEEREKIREDDARDRSNTKLRIDHTPCGYERRRTLGLVWMKPPKHFTKNLLTSCCVHRLTTSVVSSPSAACLLRHVIAGKPVTLALHAGLTTVSYVLLAHGREVYLHCMHQSLLQATSLPLPKRLTPLLSTTVNTRMNMVVRSSLMTHAWCGVSPPALDSGFDRTFPKTTLEGNTIPTCKLSRSRLIPLPF
jgi:hypothetical protein